MKPNGSATKSRLRSLSNCSLLSKEVLMIFGFSTAFKSWCLASVPQLQPDELFNVAVPFKGETVIALDGSVCFVGYTGSGSSVMSVNYRDGSTSHKSFTTEARKYYTVASRNQSIFIFGGNTYATLFSTCEKLDIDSNQVCLMGTSQFSRLTQLPNMLFARCYASALNIPEMGIIVVGGYLHRNQTMKSRYAEMLVEDEKDWRGWRWIKLNLMLEARSSPGVAHFKGCVVVVGGDDELSAECLPMTSIEQANAQWTRLNAAHGRSLLPISLASFDNRLIFLASGYPNSKVYEFLSTEENQPLANFEWKPLFELEGFSGEFSTPMLLMTRETLEER